MRIRGEIHTGKPPLRGIKTVWYFWLGSGCQTISAKCSRRVGKFDIRTILGKDFYIELVKIEMTMDNKMNSSKS